MTKKAKDKLDPEVQETIDDILENWKPSPVAMESDRFGNLFVAMDNGQVYKTNPKERRGEWEALKPLPGTDAEKETA